MAAGNLNLEVGCETCTHSDCFGRSCAHGLMFPVLVFMAGLDPCPNYKEKNIEQLKEMCNARIKQTPQGSPCQ